MRVLLDTNVLLDSILQRPPWHQDADAIVQAAARDLVSCAATALSLATVFYIARKVDAIVTRNIAHFSHSPIPAWDPPELLRRLAAPATQPPSGPATGGP